MEIKQGMKYKRYILDILYNLGVHKMYKGCEYILSGISFISENETSYSPVTKILYVEIAKEHDTSSLCVEKNIRSVIEIIWKQHANDALICKVFGSYYLSERPSNIEFLSLLYDYVKNADIQKVLTDEVSPKFTCPVSGSECEFCSEFIANFLKQYEDNHSH